jgi:L-alanine-DL-glutamate epimerase-like enolase superfamily enzyme
MSHGVPTVEGVRVAAFCIPTDGPESDGTLEWESTTMVLVEARGGGEVGLGYTYADESAARLVAGTLASEVIGKEVFSVSASWNAMIRACRNLGRPGIVSMAVSAVDVALWDLKARVCGLSIVDLLGRVRSAVPVYGSGGFTSYDQDRLCRQLGNWVEQGIAMVKMKVGRDPRDDVERVSAARRAIGREAELFVDANGAYDRKRALQQASAFAERDVSWFEEPVSSDDLEGLRLLRNRAPAGMQIAAGEYGYDLFYFRHMLEAGSVDVLQADVSRCGGISGLLGVGASCRAHAVPLSAHTVPAVHGHVGCCLESLRHVEYFHDHVRIEQMLLDGALTAQGGELRPDPACRGLGLTMKWRDGERYQTFRADLP